MTARREVPLTTDSLGWVHAELAEIRSRLALIQQATEQGRALAADAVDKANHAETRLDQLNGHGSAIAHVQDDLRVLREQLVRAQEDIHSLRQSREEAERRELTETERLRQDRNDIGRRFGELERQIESWQERVAGAEEHYRLTLEATAQLTMKLEGLLSAQDESETLQSRNQATISRIDQELSRLNSSIASLERDDAEQRERSQSALEVIRRIESELEAAKRETNRISRLDDRLELVQAERTRHNERLNELTTALEAIETRLHENDERSSLIEVRMAGLQEGLRAMNEKLEQDREQIAAFLRATSEMEADFRKRQIAALEKEARDVRGRAINFAKE